MNEQHPKPLIFVGSALKDLKKFPEAVRDDVGFDLYLVQMGKTPDTAKPLKGLGGVMELVERYNKDSYRVIYLANLGTRVYVLHCFMKKSKTGIKTPKEDIELVRKRLQMAQWHDSGGCK